MQKIECEGWVVLLDVNSKQMLRLFRDRGQGQERPLGFEDLADLVMNTLFLFALQGAENKILFMAFNEVEMKTLFPLEDSDGQLLRALDFKGIRRVVFGRLSEFLRTTAARESSHSQLVPALYSSICREFTRHNSSAGRASRTQLECPLFGGLDIGGETVRIV